MELDVLKDYTRKYWTEAKDTHVADPAYYRLAESELRGILQRHLVPGGNVLDIGCGNGEYTVILAAQAERVLAFDISDNLLAAARKRCEALDNVSFFQADVGSTKLAFDGQVNAVFCMGVFACLPDDAQLTQLLNDFAGYLVDGGLLVLRDSTVQGAQQHVHYPSGHLGYYRNKEAMLATLRQKGFDLTEEIPLKATVEPFNHYFVLHKRGAGQG
jgi:cyclopropane fatty-acyl-phospholipid synthase-like methyltransferase